MAYLLGDTSDFKPYCEVCRSTVERWSIYPSFVNDRYSYSVHCHGKMHSGYIDMAEFLHFTREELENKLTFPEDPLPEDTPWVDFGGGKHTIRASSTKVASFAEAMCGPQVADPQIVQQLRTLPPSFIDSWNSSVSPASRVNQVVNIEEEFQYDSKGRVTYSLDGTVYTLHEIASEFARSHALIEGMRCNHLVVHTNVLEATVALARKMKKLDMALFGFEEQPHWSHPGHITWRAIEIVSSELWERNKGTLVKNFIFDISAVPFVYYGKSGVGMDIYPPWLDASERGTSRGGRMVKDTEEVAHTRRIIIEEEP